jgi:hypothetical protein
MTVEVCLLKAGTTSAALLDMFVFMVGDDYLPMARQ